MLSADFQRGFCRAFLFVFIDRIKVKSGLMKWVVAFIVSFMGVKSILKS